jgi:pimeloyl-ACP methyl ester carboxylesterase
LRHFNASDGARIAYRDQGTGTPLLLLHGLMAHGGFFDAQADLADRFRVIAVDLRGHGESAAGPAPTVERIAADITELGESLDLEGAIGLGWSLGATILWHVLAGPAAARFAGAVVVDMTAQVCNDADWDLGLTPDACDARSLAIRSDFANFAANAGQAIFSQPIAPAHQAAADWASAEFAKSDPAAIGAVWESLVGQDVRALLAGIRHPTLIIHGGQSQLYSDDTADHLVETLPNAEAIRFDRSGHAPHLEEPAAFNAAIAHFADGIVAARATATA